MMEEQLDKSRGEIASVKQSKEKVAQLLRTVEELGLQSQGKEADAVTATPKGDTADEKRRELQKSRWTALHEELG